MGNGGTWRRLHGHAWLWLVLLALVSPFVSANELEVARLPDGPADAAAVVRGDLDRAFVPNRNGEAVLFQIADRPVWWRIRSRDAIPAGDEPQLVLASPYLSQVEAWVPGRAEPTRHTLYGDAVDPRYSARALVIALPAGIPVGEAVYLRVFMPGGAPVQVAVEPRDAVHATDLEYVAWRAMILSTIVVLAVLALAYWAGVGERSFVFLALTLGCAALFIAGTGGEARALPGLGELFASGPRPTRAIGCFGILFSNLFMRLYLDLRRNAPRHDRVLMALTALAGALGVACAISDARVLPTLGNLLLVCSALVVFSAAMLCIARGDRAARFLLASWLPLIVSSVLRALQMLGFLQDWDHLDHLLAASFALAGLLLTVGLSDKMLQLRRDRDEASQHASFDPITAALNRRAIDQRLAEEVKAAHAHGRPLSVAFVDIDRFKAINDTCGHSVGDQCLRYISLRVRNTLRARDLLARFGGDELLVVMPDTTLDDACTVAERMRVAVNCRPLALDDRQLDCTLSIGIAELQPGENAERLLARADAALYASKSAGRDRVSGHAAVSPLEARP
ncbi:MAG TPA: diguanylate cyclase [Lysobacter sp.]|nr:diguanylate cyclase [Lysobacter sp.]